ncbi:FkbM family methyltransferase [Roseomonas sp. SSH11]|uniref:FkbM family methyltransferase n=1 Tax=Pararoseomonas baculiformis TaxID=2820812 RepID=A0ABS4AEN3_9PROT|nr:FkbM family methyltransferase [Pararoseomonas baculiformis]MBP0445441.1 FkbM family methyltransferase [Pararoseomonas baculiformis]
MKSLNLNEKTLMYYGRLARGQASLHFSQFGEDIIINILLKKKKEGFYLDIGAHDPFVFSNTALLYHEKGWRGINVDLDQRYVDRLQEQRPRDINLCCAIGGENGTIDAVIFENGAFNTADPGRQARLMQDNTSAEKRSVPMRTIPSLLDEHLPPGATIDFLNIDVEGIDFIALQANDWTRFRPAVIAVETHGMNLHDPASNRVFQLLVSKGYQLRSQVWVTSIFTL